MDEKLNSIKLIVEDIQNQVINDNNHLNSIKSENIKKLSKLIEKSNTYSTHEWNTGYGIKNTQDRINLLFEIILEQNKRISNIEKIINSNSIDRSSPNTEDDDPDLHESACYDNNNHHDSKEL
jgi:hypothetical protein